jgi:hypothetical protein
MPGEGRGLFLINCRFAYNALEKMLQFGEKSGLWLLGDLAVGPIQQFFHIFKEAESGQFFVSPGDQLLKNSNAAAGQNVFKGWNIRIFNIGRF